MEKSYYEILGGEEAIQKLVDAFYPRVYADPDLSPLFEGDINEIKRKQKMFLTQFLGGPDLYSQEFGHPMMRYRHMNFEITPKRAEAWLRCMKEAMDEAGLEGEVREFFYDKLTQLAHFFVNREV